MDGKIGRENCALPVVNVALVSSVEFLLVCPGQTTNEGEDKC